MAVLPSHFRDRLSLAVGIAVSGTAFGGTFYAAFFYASVGRPSFAWSVRTIALVVGTTQLLPILCMRRQTQRGARPRDILDSTVFSDPPFLLFTLAATLSYMGVYVILFYISLYAKATHLVGPSMAFYLVPIVNASSIAGRVLPSIAADKIRPINRK
ncbi:hypothetical protein HK405_008676 [Cladochytrium tenue]|nr:hypothetical protein HK405_008676 [Cladochytrium tenue]